MCTDQEVVLSLIMCSSPEELRKRAEWDGVTGDSRSQLLVTLQSNSTVPLRPSARADCPSPGYISPSLMIPRRRLETLLEQAKMHQRRNCPFHSEDVSISLLADCKCDPAAFPSITSHILREHTDEIWRLEFSHDGKWLATAGRDQSTVIWNVSVRRSRSQMGE